MIQDSAGQLLTTVERVADLASLDDVPAPADVGRVDICQVIAEMIAAFQPSAIARGRNLSADPRDDQVLVPGEPDHLRRLVTELVDNPVKYTDSTQIRIDATRTAEIGVSVEVSDDGPGIPTDQQDLVFAPFTRGDAAYERGVSGSGLGLRLARRIAGRCGGVLNLHSTPAGGSTLRIQWVGPRPHHTE